MSVPADARNTAEAVARRSYGRLVAYLASRMRDVAAAEDALAEAFAAALAQWPVKGVPANPEGWLFAVAQRKQIDAVRRRQTAATAREHLLLVGDERAQPMEAHEIPDERLRLMFACAHPAIDPALRAPLILQTILGLDAATIAAVFLVAPATMGQRLVRAKLRIRETGIPFRVPDQAELPGRLDAVLSAVYAAFSEGWFDAVGETRRRGLATEAIWLGRLVASLLPDEPEPLGLLALMLYAEARRPARRSPAGDYVPLGDQDTGLWNAELISEAEGLLKRASSFGPTGRYQLEAAVQSVHCARRLTGQTDWPALRKLYDALSMLSDSPVIALNRAVALCEAGELAEALAELNRLAAEPRFASYQPYWAARAALLGKAGQIAAAVAACDRAIELEQDPAVREYLARQRAKLNGTVH